MNWIKNLLEPLLDRLALKLALKICAQMDCAIDAALDRADDRIDTAIKGLEERLQAAATKPIADLKVTLGPVLDLQRQALEAEKLRADAFNPRRAGGGEIKHGVGYLVGDEPGYLVGDEPGYLVGDKAAGNPNLARQQQIEAISPERLEAAAEATGTIPATEVKAHAAFAASMASAAARDQLRSGLTPAVPRPWKEIPDR
jgi:hypothetical protein